MVDDSLTVIAKQQWDARTKTVAALKTPAEITARQERVRSKFIELLGGFPEKTPLNATVTGILERPGYRVEKVIFESRPKFYVTANLYVPETGPGPFPAVLGTAGHSMDGKAYAVYQHAWIGLVKRGFVVLAYDPVGQGERVQYFDPELGRSRLDGSTAEHTTVGLQCLLTGTALGGWFVWDGIRAFDYLLTRKEVDASRIAVTGCSGGGMQSAYLAIAEPRLAAAAPSCYMTSAEKLWTELGPQDAEQNVPGTLAAGLGFGDFPLAFAPKPFQFLTATRDFFPIAGAHETFSEARTIYSALGRPDRVDLFEADFTHGFSQPQRESMYRWFSRWLQNRADEGVEGDFAAEAESDLNCTPTGQVSTSLGGETVQSLNRAAAERLARERSAPNPRELPARIAARLRIAAERKPPAASQVGEIRRPGYRIEKIVLRTDPGIQVPALLFLPAAEGRKPATLYVNPAGKAADAGEDGAILALVGNGQVVLAPDLRGWGESRNEAGSPPHDAAFVTAMRAILVGKTPVGMRTADLLAAFDYLAGRSEVDPQHIGVIGKDNGGIVALYAAALEARISRTVCEGAFLSYLDVARARFYEGLAESLAPDILKDFDLPDVAAAIAPRELWIVRPRMPSGAKEWLATARAEYAPVLAAYARAGANESFRVLARPAVARISSH